MGTRPVCFPSPSAASTSSSDLTLAGFLPLWRCLGPFTLAASRGSLMPSCAAEFPLPSAPPPSLLLDPGTRVLEVANGSMPSAILISLSLHCRVVPQSDQPSIKRGNGDQAESTLRNTPTCKADKDKDVCMQAARKIHARVYADSTPPDTHTLTRTDIPLFFPLEGCHLATRI